MLVLGRVCRETLARGDDRECCVEKAAGETARLRELEREIAEPKDSVSVSGWLRRCQVMTIEECSGKPWTVRVVGKVDRPNRT